MSFSLSGSIITQTGTDTDLTGLSGIAGVTIYGNIYFLDGVFLRVEGALTFNGMDERIVFVNQDDSGTGVDYASIYVDTGATLTVECDRGVQVTGFTETTLFAPVIDFGTRNIPTTGGGSTSYSTGRKFISVHPSGTINLSGVILGENSNTSGILTAMEGVANLVDCKLIFKTVATTNTQFSFAGTVSFTNAELIGAVLTDRGATFTFDGFTAGEAPWGILLGGAVTTSKTATIRNLLTYNIANFDLRINMTGTTNYGTLVLINSAKGANDNTYLFEDNAGYGFAIFQSEITLNFIDTDGASADVVVYAVDVDNGNRNGTIIVTGGTNINSNDDIVYSGNTTSGTIDFDVYTGFVSETASGINIDNRGVSDGPNIKFSYFKYGYNFAEATPELIGLGAKSTTLVTLPDILITEASKATVDAYTSIDSPQEYYDYRAAYLEDNFTGIDTRISRSGDVLELGSENLTIDATAVSVYDHSTKTIKSSFFTGSITTAGTVTLVNGAVVNGTITDSTGTRTRASLTLTGLKENSEVRIYEAGTTNELAGVENSGTSFTYTYDHTTDFDVDIVIASLNFINIKLTNNTLTSTNSSIPIQQQVDRNYENP